jgi:glucokinase
MIFPLGVVSPLHIPAWRDFPLRDRLQAAFNLPVIVENDAKAFALGEARFGAGQGVGHMLGMILSTGVGGGFVFDGKLYHGASGNAGHIGHTIVAPAGPACDCGARGCLTVVASGTGLVQRARDALAQAGMSVLAELAPEALTGQGVIAAASQGDALALRLLRQAADGVACAIADAAVMFDLDTVVIGGGLMQAGALLLEPIKAALTDRMRLSFTGKLALRAAALGPVSGIIGAAALALEP